MVRYQSPPERQAGEAPGPARVSAYRAKASPGVDTGIIEGINDGYSPELRIGSEGTTPDDIRVGKREAPLHMNDPRYFAKRSREEQERYLDQEFDNHAGPLRQEKPYVPPIVYQTTERAPIRQTALRSQADAYLTQREWLIPPAFTGEHVSLADHRRDYAIYGMKPQGRLGVNHYRKDPQPWDSTLYARSPTAEDGAPAVSWTTGNRSYRK